MASRELPPIQEVQPSPVPLDDLQTLKAINEAKTQLDERKGTSGGYIGMDSRRFNSDVIVEAMSSVSFQTDKLLIKQWKCQVGQFAKHLREGVALKVRTVAGFIIRDDLKLPHARAPRS